MIEQVMLFSGTMLASLLGAVLGLGLGALLGGWLGSIFARGEKGVDEGWALAHLVRGGLIGLLPGLVLGGIFGFRWLVAWLQGG